MFPNKIILSNSLQDIRELKVAGAMLYWAEGYKGSIEKPADRIDFTNSDPDMISVFVTFLRTIFILDEQKFRILLYAYSDQNIPELISFWSLHTKIPKEQFTKPYIRTDFRIDGRKMKYGLVHIRYYDKKLLSELKKMIHSYSLSLLQKHQASVG